MQEQFRSRGLTETIGREHFYPTVEAAVRACSEAEAAGLSSWLTTGGIKGPTT